MRDETMPPALPDHLTPAVRAALREAAAALHALYGERLRHLMLFGSQARGDTHAESDVDVLVVLAGPVDSYEEAEPLARLTGRLFDRHGVWLSLMPFGEERYRDAHHPLLMHIGSEGMEL